MAPSFSTKAGTLKSLVGSLQNAVIANLFVFTVESWNRDRELILSGVNKNLGSGPWIVRSSCAQEDNLQNSGAGAYQTIKDVDQSNFEDSVDRVVQSYGSTMPNDEILIQPMLEGIYLSGVAFSHDPNTCSPYRVVNYAYGEDSSLVTGGQGGKIWQEAHLSQVAPPKELVPVISLVKELEETFRQQPLDCEFALTKNADKEVLWLLQVRPLILLEKPESPDAQAERLMLIENRIARGIKPHQLLKGKRTVYGVMPDWNPAEIIGVRPRPLALSLYRELVTDTIWAYQRDNYGYRNLRSFPLMVHFFGLPYVDVRVSFNSFIPADLNSDLADKLVDYYVDRLLAEPALHDKVEFDVVFSSYTLDLHDRLKALSECGFSQRDQDDICESLRRLTNNVLHPEQGLWRKDAAKIDILNERRDKLLASDADVLERIYWLLEDAKRYGTLPFAGLARAGFIAIQMLRSLVSVGVFSEVEFHRFLESLSTVSGQLAKDRASMKKEPFLSKYGHLRPGTYDIMSPRYDESPDLYFDWSLPSVEPQKAQPFSLSLDRMDEISRLLELHNLEVDCAGLLEFIRAGVEQREFAKFNFSKNLSAAITLIAKYGETYGFSAEEMSFCDIQTLYHLHIAALDPRSMIESAVEQGRERYKHTQLLSLPPVIVNPADVWGFEWPDTEPNFITQNQVTGIVVSCDSRDRLAGAIVCIPNADPGFDWLFSYGIGGLVTAWGGANSHMAIRASELGLPAVIGCGERLYQYWSNSTRLHLDCAGHRVEVLM
ncbi:MAG: hypothetical protein ACJAVI_005983 [Candidatus Azotimanducaceae bacterium]|jgi:hypothetical protein